MSPFPDPLAVQSAVIAELDRGDAAAALAILHPVAHALASEMGADFRALIERIPVEIWHRDPLIAAALGQSYRASDAPRGAPGLAYFAAAEDVLTAEPAHRRASVLAGHAAALRGAGRFVEARAKLAAAEALVAGGLDGLLPEVMAVRARCALEHGILDLHAGAHDGAREHLLVAQGLADAHLDRAEQAECAGALALLDFGFADAHDAALRARAARAITAGTSLARSGFAAPGYAAETLIAIERGDMARAAALEPELVRAAITIEWEPYAHLISGSLRAVLGRPAESLDVLGEAERGFRRWDASGFGRDYTALIRASQLNVLGRGDEAWEHFSRLVPSEHHILCPGYYIASQLLAGGDLHGADAALRACEALGDEHAQRGALHVRLLRGAIADGLGDRETSALNVDLAFIGMVRSGSRAPLRTVPAGLLAGLAEAALRRPHTPEVRQLLEETRRATLGAEHRIEPLSRRERLVLAELVCGATVAAIATAMFISPNTVKTHLRRVYRKLGVATREEAIRRARTLGLHELGCTQDHP